MSFLSSLFRKPEPLPHVVVRYHAATKAENKLARRKAIDMQLMLAVAVCTLTPEQKQAAIDRACSPTGKGR